MRRSLSLLAAVMMLCVSPAYADGAFLSRLPPNVGAPRVERPRGENIFDIRALVDGAVRTAVSLHNDAMHDTNNLDLEYGYTIRMSGQVMAENTLTHRRHANWREVVWAGAPPSSAHVAYDYPYMIASGAVPAYDPTLPLSRSFLRAGPAAMARADTAVMGGALIPKAMADAGGAPGMGMLPDWTLAWLRSQSAQHRHIMMQNAAAAGSVPWHLRDTGTKGIARLDAQPGFWMDARATEAANGHGPIEGNVDGWQVDAAHAPDLSYLPYLISGDRYFLDELHAQLAAALFAHDPARGRRDGAAGAMRGAAVAAQAGANRTHGFAAWITPDAHPKKEYLVDLLRSRLTWYARRYAADEALGGKAGAQTAGWIDGASAPGVLAPWQQDAFAASLAQVARTGVAESGAVFAMIRPFLLNRFLRDDFHPAWATAPRLVNGDRRTGEAFDNWGQIARASLAARAIESPPRTQSGNPDHAGRAAAQARAGYASMIGAFADPLMAGAYAVLVRNTLAMQEGRAGFAVHPQFSIVPVFPDGTILSLADHRAVNGRAQGSARNDLLAGGPRPDMLLGGDGNDILAGQGGDDTLAGGSGWWRLDPAARRRTGSRAGGQLRDAVGGPSRTPPRHPCTPPRPLPCRFGHTKGALEWPLIPLSVTSSRAMWPRLRSTGPIR